MPTGPGRCAGLAQATSLCGPAPPSPPRRPPPHSTTHPASGGSGSTSCSAALGQATSDQSQVAADIKQVDQDEKALTTALESSSGIGRGHGGRNRVRQHGQHRHTVSARQCTDSAGSTTSTGSTSFDRLDGLAGGYAKKATPQQIAVDQASVDTAQANLTDAQEAVAGANLVSTIAGTVASVSIAAGDSVTAGSSTSSPPDRRDREGLDLRPDDRCGGGRHRAGRGGPTGHGHPRLHQHGDQRPGVGDRGRGHQLLESTTYPVTITLDSPDLGQLSGVDGDVQIVTQRAVNVTTVPSSAVRTVGTVHLVTVVKDGKPTPVRVTLGTVGDVLTQVKSGRNPWAARLVGRPCRAAAVHVLDRHPFRRSRWVGWRQLWRVADLEEAVSPGASVVAASAVRVRSPISA